MAAASSTLRWPAAPGATRYRVVVRHEPRREIVHTGEAYDASYELAPTVIRDDGPFTWKVRVPSAGGSWVDWLPYMHLPLPAPHPGRTTLLTWPSVGSSPAMYRVVLRDETQIVAAHVVCEAQFMVDWGRLDARRSWRYRVQVRAADGSWADHVPYRPVQAGAAARVAALAAEQVDGRAPKRTPILFLFTVDTEATIRRVLHPDKRRAVDEQVFGRWHGRDCGIGYMMDVLDRHKIRGTFFVDVLMHYQFGRDALERVVDFIRRRGHDIQLHLHPKPHFYWSSEPRHHELIHAMHDASGDLFRRALELAVECFARVVGRPPLAYRAGSYHLQPSAFPILSEFGIRFDSSIFPFKNCCVPAWMQAHTRPFRVGDLVEVPVSWMIERRGDAEQFRQYALNTRLLPAIRAGVERLTLERFAPQTLVFMAHSYTLVRENREPGADALRQWNDEFRTICPPRFWDALRQDETSGFTVHDGPDEERMQMFEGVIEAMASTPGVQGLSFAQLAERPIAALCASPAPVAPIVEWRPAQQRAHLTGLRKYSQSYLAHLEQFAAAEAEEAGVA